MKTILRFGIAGLGVASTQVLPAFEDISNKIRLTAVADIRKEALSEFAQKYPHVKTFESIEAMLTSSDIDAVWIATPNHLHADHTILAAKNGKHVICEKPMAITIDQCNKMAEAVSENNIKYVQGHSKIYTPPIRKMREIIKSDQLGQVISIDTWNYNDWLVRPLTVTEVNTKLGSGVVFRQGPHHADIVRFLGGGLVKSVSAITSRSAPGFSETEGNYTAFLEFENGITSTMIFDGYGYFDITELTWGIGESGATGASFSANDREWPTGPIEFEKKYKKVSEGDPHGHRDRINKSIPIKQPFFGLTIVSCEKGVIRQSPQGLFIYSNKGREELIWKPNHLGRAAEMLELYKSIEEDREPFLDVTWGKASLEICLAILKSSETQKEVMLEHQVACKEIPGW
jgi:phthalate 4,5-cis-dihydrodiol dehydrogenase